MARVLLIGTFETKKAELDYLATALFSKVEAPLFIQQFINPTFQNTDPDPAIIAAAHEARPQVFDYLESQLVSGRPFLLGDQCTLADLTAGSIFVNYFQGKVYLL